MNDTILNDEEEDQRLATTWIPEDWISCGKKYHDIPAVVQAARRNLLKIPPSFIHHVPPKTLSIASLLSLDLPPLTEAGISPMDVEAERFCDFLPNRDLEDILPFLRVPNRAELQQLLAGLIRPLYAHSGLRVTTARSLTPPKRRNDGVEGLWTVLPWHGSIVGVKVSELASFFSTDYLGTDLVDAMVDLLSIRLAAADKKNDGTLIVNTTFAQFIDLLRPGNDGRSQLPKNGGAQKYLEKYGAWSRNPAHTNLNFVLYRPPKHWTACSIDFRTRHIRYGDSLKWARPEEFFNALDAWTSWNFMDKFTVTDDLPCAVQSDGYNCPIISVNTVAHNVFGDPLWTAQSAKAMRMKAFCDIVNLY
ncbi:hypothetical protein C8R47DRAFT_1153221 [Mycena vitilis]|nr:hypothetical protein C8R47DRAFT_1153221 [Mycena vitilis]